jgi:large conductance mechanosensitive channel
MGIAKEFKQFALQGNVVDLAVGVIIGGAFGKIVDSVVNDLIMPVVGRAIGNADFSNLYLPLSDKVEKGLALDQARALGPVFAYGHFLTICIDFIIMAFIIFLMIKAINNLQRKEEAAPSSPSEPSAQEKLLMEIRDALKK